MILDQSLHVLDWIGERWSKRLDLASARFKDILILEKALLEKSHQKKDSKAQDFLDSRKVEGWLVAHQQSKVIPLYAGGNQLEDTELRLVGNALLIDGKSFASNDEIEIAGRRYLLKLLPPLYRQEGMQL